MIRFPVVKPVALAVLALPFGGRNAHLEAQSTGVLQARVRVVDYGSSLGVLRAAGLAKQTYQQSGRIGPGVAGSHLYTTQQTAGDAARRPEAIVVTISYLH